MFVQVCGAAREVTGSCYLFDVDGTRFLVDCGMHQGGDKDEAQNFHRFSFDPRGIDFVILNEITKVTVVTLANRPVEAYWMLRYFQNSACFHDAHFGFFCNFFNGWFSTEFLM